MTDIATWIKAQREQRGMSLSDLARALGVPSGTVSRWESGERVPTAQMCLRLARVFGADPDEVLRLAGRAKPRPAYTRLHDLLSEIEQRYREDLALLRSALERLQTVFVPVMGVYPAATLAPYPTDQVIAIADEVGDDAIAVEVTREMHPRFGVVPGDHVIVDRKRAPEIGDPCLLAGARLQLAWRGESWWVSAEDGLPIHDDLTVVGTVVTIRPTGSRRLEALTR